jgi:hypothetical protein
MEGELGATMETPMGKSISATQFRKKVCTEFDAEMIDPLIESLHQLAIIAT